jgi:hypothetical protein
MVLRPSERSTSSASKLVLVSWRRLPGRSPLQRHWKEESVVDVIVADTSAYAQHGRLQRTSLHDSLGSVLSLAQLATKDALEGALNGGNANGAANGLNGVQLGGLQLRVGQGSPTRGVMTSEAGHSTGGRGKPQSESKES